MSKKEVPIVTACSAEFLKYAIVMIWSVMEAGNIDTEYVFYIYHNDIPKERQLWLKEQLSSWVNCKIDLIDIRELEQKWALDASDWSGKVSCLYFFCIDSLLQYDKVIALDIDLIVKKNISQLYDIDLGNNFLSAVYDLDFIGQWLKRNERYHSYYKQELQLSNPTTYIQAGVLSINLYEIRKKFPKGFFVEVASKKKFRFDDQDIWNLYCADHILKLDYRWNIMHDNNNYRVRYVIDLAPKEEVKAYLAARKTPYIIHYAGDQKPWNDKNCDFGREYWNIVEHIPKGQEMIQEGSRKGSRRWKGIRRIYYECQRVRDKLFILWNTKFK